MSINRRKRSFKAENIDDRNSRDAELFETRLRIYPDRGLRVALFHVIWR